MIELDVFSNCQVYGKDFADANDKQYQALYDHAKKLPNVNYLGFRNNEWIKDILKIIICLYIQVYGKKHFVYRC